MTDEDAMEAVIAQTGVQRYRHLCSDANRLPPPNAPADWRRHMHEILGQAGDPDVVIRRIEAMGRRAQAGERGGGCGGCP